MTREGVGGDPVARLFQRLLGVVFFVAWASLGVQVDVLIGSRGLLPATDLVGALATRPDITFFDVPTLFRWGASDGALHAGVWGGLGLAVAIVVGVLPRTALAVSTALYLSYAVLARTFLSFQWDNLLLECGFLATFLPTRRRSRWALFLLRVLLFKLYFESGIAKYASYLGDWKDGSAMAYYYETAPIPTRLAWYAHHSPLWFHSLESRATLAFEILVPFLVFGPRLARRVALAVFTGFQLVNIATANYGFFSHLALVLGVLLLDARDVRALGLWWRRVMRRLPAPLARWALLCRRTGVAYRLFLRRRRRAVAR
ncbi:MAG TPA: lipase maturation factor family protein, partial [Polyangiaceae bacterium]|nr:lipase maturation factor family protein [Polyangiaceae bacterium]